jgi:ribonucleoside-diphosphate reductase alpha chain
LNSTYIDVKTIKFMKNILKLDTHIENILKERYYLKNESSWQHVSHRLSETILPEMYDAILNRTFIPSTPTIMNLNTKGERIGTLSSCFILDIEDSMGEIMDSMKDAAYVTKAAGGVGYNFSKLRGSTENVKSISANSGGVMAFIGIFDAVLDGVRQGGRRRGAGMSMLSIYHPDILKFVDAKQKEGVYERSNFSVAPDTEFYEVLQNDPYRIFQTKNVVDGKRNDLVDEKGMKYTYQMLWDKIIHNAWSFAEPGIFNSDISADRCTCKHITRNVFCNPCSEYVHIPYTSCNLASLNILHFVKNKKIDWNHLGEMVGKSVVYLNGIIDQNDYPIEKIRKETLNVRPIGLGVMGVAHAMYALGIPYDSQEAYNFGEKLSRFITIKGMQRSMELAREKGESYPYFDYDVYIDANKRFFTEDEFMGINLVELKENIKKYGARNSCITSIAPTGTISYIADCSSGIEPVFGLVFTRKIEKENKVYEHVYLVDPVFKKYVESYHEKDSEKIYKYVSGNKGSCQGCKHLTEEEQSIFKVAGDITPEWHVKVLSAFANNVSLSVSKTINLPKDCSEKELGDVFLQAHKLGIIGVTVYRDGSRRGILVHDDSATKLVKTNAPERPDLLSGEVHQFTVDGKKYYAAVGLLDGNPFEIFTGRNEDKNGNVYIPKQEKLGNIVKEGKRNYVYHTSDGESYVLTNGHSSDTADALSRMCSVSLRHGADIAFVVEQLGKVEGSLVCYSKVLARTLKKYIKDNTVSTEECSCGTKYVYSEGCKKCPSCGSSKCG